ncbi:MAG TPA: helix-turn-helix transcriptional regulator [Puia sp.]|nr:helix-turn-helix transcriptional regulator [Puia sp.]
MNKEEKDLLRKIGARIVRIRKERQITQFELASRFHADKQTVQRIEAGLTNATILTLLKVAKGLEVTLAEIIDVD